MVNNDLFKNEISVLQEILTNNEVYQKKLLEKIRAGNKKVYECKAATVSGLTEKFMELLPEGLCAKLLQLKASRYAYVGGSNIMSHQEKGTLLQALINEAIGIDPEKGSKMYISGPLIYVDDIHIENLGITLFEDGPYSLKKIVEEINTILSQFCELSVESDDSPTRPSYQCFTIEFKQ